MEMEIVKIKTPICNTYRSNQELRARNYSLARRNKHLVYSNRAMFILNAILLIFIFIRFVVG